MNGVLKETEDEAHNKKWWIGACCVGGAVP